MLISEKIFKLMEERGIGLMEFSRKTGISHSTISDWRRKKTNPSADKILVICDVLGVNPYELLQLGDDGADIQRRDYIVVTKGTACHELVIEFEELSADKKERLFGYLSALKG